MKSLDQFLHEAQGKEWSEFLSDKPMNPSYSTDPRAYHELTGWAQKEKWWPEFCHYMWRKSPNAITQLFVWFSAIMLSPPTGARAIGEWLGWKEGK